MRSDRRLNRWFISPSILHLVVACVQRRLKLAPDVSGEPARRFDRVTHAVLICSIRAGSWWGMQFVHEFGHMLGAWLSGGTIERTVLHPLTISRTDVAPNPHPLVVVWMGPITGVLLPLLIWIWADRNGWSGAFLCRFFAGFCLVANGLYLGVGSFSEIGDCGVMLAHGSPRWTLWLFAILAVPAGFRLWHGQGKDFGLGPDKRPIAPHTAWGMLGVCLLLVLIGLIINGR